jgi:hypothetical protein
MHLRCPELVESLGIFRGYVWNESRRHVSVPAIFARPLTYQQPSIPQAVDAWRAFPLWISGMFLWISHPIWGKGVGAARFSRESHRASPASPEHPYGISTLRPAFAFSPAIPVSSTGPGHDTLLPHPPTECGTFANWAGRIPTPTSPLRHSTSPQGLRRRLLLTYRCEKR